MNRLGTSVDWSISKFTMDDDLSEVVTDAFIKLFDEGLIYKDKRLVNWDPQVTNCHFRFRSKSKRG